MFVLQKEWLCLNCQTQKASSGQLGDVAPLSMASPKKQEPAPPSAPSSVPVPAAVDSKPVAEGVDPIPPASEPQVANAPTPISSEHTHTPIEKILQETPDSEELKESSPDKSESDQQILHSKSLDEINSEIPPVENKLLNSEDSPHHETEIPDTNQQTQSATASDILEAEEQQRSCEETVENCSKSDAQILNVEPNAQCAPTGEIPTVEQKQYSSENGAESLSLAVEYETQNPLTSAALDKTAASVEAETRLDTKIPQSESAAPPEDHKNVESTIEKLQEVTIEPAAFTNHEEVTQEMPPVKQDCTEANVNKDTVSNDKPKNVPAELTPSDTTLDISKIDLIEKSEADIVAPVVTNDVTAENMSATELITSVDSPAKVDVPATHNTGQELHVAPEDNAEGDISSVREIKISFVASEEVSLVTETKNELIEKKEEAVPHNLADTSVVAPPEKDTHVSEKPNKQNADETKDSVNIVDNNKTAVDEIHEKDDEVVVVDTAVIVGKAKATGVKSLKEEGITNKTLENTTNQKVIQKHSDDKCLIEEVSNNAESILMEKKEVKKKIAPAVIVPEGVTKEEVQINKDTQQETTFKAVEGSPVKTVPFLKEPEEKENSSAEDASQTRKESLEDTTLKVDEQSDKAIVISDPPSVESKQQETDAFEVPVKSGQSVSTCDIIEVKRSNKTCEDEVFLDEAEVGLSAIENQNGPEKVVERSVKNTETETDTKVDESSPVVGSLQEAISVSKARAVCDNDCNTLFDVEASSTSEKNEASEHVPALEPSIPVEESETQFVVSEHDAGSKEDNVEEEMKAKAKPVGKHGDDDVVSEVTIMSIKCSSRSLIPYDFFFTIFPKLLSNTLRCKSTFIKWN